MRTLLKVLVGLALSALSLFLFLHNLDLAKVRVGIASASLPLLVLALAIGYIGHLTVRSLRWATMLSPLKARISFYNLFSTTAIGYVVSWLGPGRLGEVVRPVLLARREGLPAGAGVATIAVERILDAATILALAAAAAVSAPLWWAATGGSVSVRLPGIGEVDLLRAAPWLGGAGLLACVAGYIVARRELQEGSYLLGRLERGETNSSGVGRRLWGIARSLTAGALFLRDPRRAALVGLQSLLVWTTIGLGTWIGLLAAGVRIPFAGVFLLLAAATVGIAVPTPGGFGPVQVLFQKTLTGLFGIETTRASVATVIYHPVLVYIPPVVFGLLFAWRDGLSLSSLRALARGAPEERQGSLTEASKAIPGRSEPVSGAARGPGDPAGSAGPAPRTAAGSAGGPRK